MKFSEKWLREWIDPQVSSKILHEQISNSGIEVEHVENFKSEFHGVVVGKIVQCTFHNESNNLKVLKVDIGKKKLLNIICGASNCRNGIKVAVATVGATLPKNITINKKILKGAWSEGMLCSFFELGLFLNDNKIIEFPKETLVGINVYDYFLLEDNIIKVSITSNRPDGLSILGLSRNIAAINDLRISPLKNRLVPAVIQKKINIDIQADKECMNFFGRIIENININVDTPFWMKKKLFFSNVLSENIITNIIHYVLIELGQPLNILDADNINDSIIVRMARHEEDLFLKNNIKISLNENILVFSDSNKILSLPGNINSNIVDVDKNTKNIFLSSYLINRKYISYIIKKMNMNTVLEYHYYGVDPFLQNYAIEYATDLILKICGGVPGPINEKKCNFQIHKNNTIRLHHERLNKIIGFFIDTSVISKILYRLDYQLKFQKTFWDVISPSWRFDILIEEDVIGDILRIYEYNNVHLIPLKEFLNCSKKNELTDSLLKKSAVILINQGYHEVINYGFIDPKIQNLIFPNEENLLLSNPISQDMSCMRLSLWPGLLKNISYNKNRQQKSIRIFESGLCFSIDKRENLGIRQEIFLAAAISGNYIKENWYYNIRKMDFYDLKGDLESILESICQLNEIEFRRKKIHGLHPEQSASIYFRNYLIGSIGAIDPRLEKALNVSSTTFLFEISLNNFSDIKPLKVEEISKFPTVRRDIAILISEEIAAYNVIEQCKIFFINEKVEINLFDIYAYKESHNHKKSLGISFIFQNKKRTFQDNEINLMIDDCIGVLQKKFQAVLRK
ncbi:phenylalanine--tRNA ligase subunit beta [Buchnera aphidicola str. APS (Acyrthosiphon pisum)]|uniref:Phenylalanine--tRNA ligase beta subunit n=1 Tax=Buchnera aphidicola subsp. Acyrthosiphon pisum (strain APS) TaxID=107806 RepID=SYFB_BUCAI|nr:phenylalanine--tRNA ligase subunit beta [Buchnera aphidicola]P57230.1 RecName: Full=Phenylalanine--tRNA ligase beta subunit; AltName: Full=Phenylalanyl-tRNA synthetase beta subunit; Short=PheRS [Buchnera aphidicola str. APS (Acyrthosiphon pisum)]pir/H84944/ phenylalanine-tRNA ligase (EC 6.1.1.20) beta chain [imported] - Buchnera sp. (strain APS) [Buchnera sp. (in: enterobacteria)]BAB12848.1 phenylalanyl-tRNA synthetase beta chain [Buchnera aphidicola str. APS (Acyrthosiphon pisum)]